MVRNVEGCTGVYMRGIQTECFSSRYRTFSLPVIYSYTGGMNPFNLRTQRYRCLLLFDQVYAYHALCHV